MGVSIIPFDNKVYLYIFKTRELTSSLVAPASIGSCTSAVSCMPVAQQLRMERTLAQKPPASSALLRALFTPFTRRPSIRLNPRAVPCHTPLTTTLNLITLGRVNVELFVWSPIILSSVWLVMLHCVGALIMDAERRRRGCLRLLNTRAATKRLKFQYSIINKKRMEF